MSEHELIKPAKRIGKNLRSKDISFWKKTANIVGEMLIIIFAISFSLLMERWRESSNNKEIEKEFLTGLRNDLTDKIVEFKNDSASYTSIYHSWRYLYRVSTGETAPNEDSVSRAGGSFGYVLLLNSNNSLFESIKSSGKLNVIHNKKLLENIIGLYQESIPSLIKSIEQFYYPTNGRINDILDERWIRKGKGNLTQLLLTDNALSNKLAGYYKIQVVIGFYASAIKHSKWIIEEINKELAK